MIKKYVDWIKEYWKKFFTPAGLAIYAATIVTSNIIGKALSAFFSKKADKEIKKLEEKNGSKDYQLEARIESSYNQAEIITGAVAGTILSVISMILIAKLPKKGEN